MNSEIVTPELEILDYLNFVIDYIYKLIVVIYHFK